MTTGSIPAGDQRTAYIRGLRALADALERDDRIDLPDDGNHLPLAWGFFSGTDPRASMAAVARALPVRWEKTVRESEQYGSFFDLRGSLYGLKLRLTADRDAVCERVVTGTREVTEKVKDPEKLAEVPEIEVTRTVEDVRWECRAILTLAAETEPESGAAA